mmetsp:Transcript_294/g.881  ORF Transcript_294/g.881 Transcript_294/m.881 type:complete len:214 (-) Transcript_294:1536-2177(-)
MNGCELGLDVFHLLELALKLVAASLQRLPHALYVEHRVETDFKRILNFSSQEAVEVVQQRHQEEAVKLELNALYDIRANAAENLTHQQVDNVERDRFHRSIPQGVLYQIHQLGALQIRGDHFAAPSTLLFSLVLAAGVIVVRGQDGTETAFITAVQRPSDERGRRLQVFVALILALAHAFIDKSSKRGTNLLQKHFVSSQNSAFLLQEVHRHR